MGIVLNWQLQVFEALQEQEIEVQWLSGQQYGLLLCNQVLVINLVPLDNGYTAAALIELQAGFQLKGITLLQLWEDIWHSRTVQVLGRIKSLLGLNRRLHGRSAKIVKVNQQQADEFMEANHIQGAARSRYKYALELEGRFVAVACFSNIRYMKKIAEGYRSVELIRFATLMGFTVAGGFTRLLQHLIRTIGPDDVMSYADRDWSLGNAYAQSGFKLTAVTAPAGICLRKADMQRFFPHRLPLTEARGVASDSLAPRDKGFLPVFNTGNLKYVLYLNKAVYSG